MIARPTNTTTPERTPVTCAHCALTVPSGLVDHSAERQFCCAGCRAVWNALHSEGLEKFYELAEGRAERATVSGRGFEALDDEAFLETHAETVAADRCAIELVASGVHCGACVWLVERLPRLHPGVVAARVNLGRQTIRLEWSPSATSLSAVARRLDRLGYQLRPVASREARAAARQDDRRWLIRIGVAGAIAGNVMAIAFALYGDHFHGMEQSARLFLQAISLGLTGLALAWPGRLFFENAIAAIRARTPHMDMPVALGLSAGTVGGVVALASGGGEIYLESVTMLVFLLLVGRFVQHRQQRRAHEEIESLYHLAPAIARRRAADGSTTEVPSSSLQVGDLVEVDDDDAAPADGVLESSAAWVDQALLTGESTPVRLARGDEVLAGVRAAGTPLLVRVERSGDATRIAALMRTVADAASERTPIMRFADRVAGWFLLIVLTLAILVFTGWTLASGASVGLQHAIALLVVSCPCALGLATPLSIVSAVGRAARLGIMVKGGETIERLAREGADDRAGTIWLDKTGTITDGRVAVQRVIGDVAVARAAVMLERTSRHPIALAMRRWMPEADEMADEHVDRIRREERIGRGVVGTVGNAHLVVGNERLLAEESIEIDGAHRDAADEMLAEGLTPVFVARRDAIDGDHVVAIVGVGDPIRRDAPDVVAALRAEGWSVGILSGDHPTIARAVGTTIGIDADRIHGALQPEDKLRIVREDVERRRADARRSKAGAVVVVGDGVNDAAAMAAADVGVAVQGAAAAALGTADVCLGGGGIAPLHALTQGARRTMRVIHLNLGVSLVYNVTGATLAAAGLVNPILAAILMPLSGLTVLTLAWKMPTFRGSDLDAMHTSSAGSPRRHEGHEGRTKEDEEEQIGVKRVGSTAG